MVRMLHHRGPDEEGSVTLPGVGLGMRRLSIVDLAGGQQPIPNETGDIKIVANGEIYNFPSCAASSRATATRSARATRTSKCSSTPTSNGVRISSSRLRGMFALAIWDGRTRTLIAARDRAGEKPLYWTLTPRGPAARVGGQGAAGAARGLARARSRWRSTSS